MPISLSSAAANGHAHTLNLKANGKTSANGNGVAKNGHAEPSHHASGSALLTQFIDSYKELEAYKYVTSGTSTGHSPDIRCVGTDNPFSWMGRLCLSPPLLRLRVMALQ